jgi:hypothetical protein
MGWFSNFKAATTVSLATQFVRKHLEIQRDLGLFHGDVADTAKTLVLALWADIPGLREQRERPNPSLVAAAALSKGVKHFDGAGNKALADTMVRALKTLLQHDVYKLARPEEMSAMDVLLWDLAHHPFEAEPP